MNAARQLLAGLFKPWNALDHLLDLGHARWNLAGRLLYTCADHHLLLCLSAVLLLGKGQETYR